MVDFSHLSFFPHDRDLDNKKKGWWVGGSVGEMVEREEILKTDTSGC